MRLGGFVVCLLCITVNAAGTERKLRGSTDRHSQRDQRSLSAAGSAHEITDLAHRHSHKDQHSLHHERVFRFRSRRKLKLRVPASAAKLLQRSQHLVSEKAWLQKKAEALHDEWIKPFSSVKEFLVANNAELIVSALLWLAFVVFVAFFYQRSPRYNEDWASKQRDPVDPVELSTWKAEWYQCYQYPEAFFWACCCPCIRWGHTMDLLQFLDYWPALLLFMMLAIWNQLTGFVLFGFFLTCILVFYRQKTRKLFGMENHGTCLSVMMDFLGYCFCWPCFIAQEANHVTQAKRLGWTKELAEKSGLFAGRHEPSASQEG